MNTQDHPDENGAPKERLSKVLAASGIGSRRKCEQLIRDGLLRVDGQIVRELGFKIDPLRARIELSGSEIGNAVKPICFIINKPRCMISTCSDPEGRPTVLDLLKRKCNERLYPVGRLDWDSQGLMLLTNDGEIANILTHPRYEVEKEYLLKVRGIPSEKTILRARKGVHLEDGRARAKRVEIASKTDRNAWLRVIVKEGRNRLLKRMFQALGHPVVKLKRERIFYLKLGRLQEGESIPMTDEQIDMLRRRCRKIEKAVSDKSNAPSQRRKAKAIREKRGG
ncbi:rRNA pseudouridine synthase [bacterium]|nr:rRNA pseudouridine synthase [bacterium]